MPEPGSPPDAVGVVPAAGRGSRLGRLPFSKELYPVDFGNRGTDGAARPRAACEHLLGALSAAGVERTLVVIRDGKWDIPSYLGAGLAGGTRLAYVLAAHPHGVPFSVASATPHAAESRVVMGFPDIVFDPVDAPARVLASLAREEADLVLGLFPVDDPSLRGTVEVDEEGRVTAVVSKDPASRHPFCWILAAWGPAFSRFLARWVGADLEAMDAPEPGGERGMGDVMQAALREGLDVRGVRFPGGSFRDIGTPEELRAAVLAGAAIPEGAGIPEGAAVENGADDPAGGAPAGGRHDGTEEDERT